MRPEEMRTFADDLESLIVAAGRAYFELPNDSAERGALGYALMPFHDMVAHFHREAVRDTPTARQHNPAR